MRNGLTAVLGSPEVRSAVTVRVMPIVAAWGPSGTGPLHRLAPPASPVVACRSSELPWDAVLHGEVAVEVVGARSAPVARPAEGRGCSDRRQPRLGAREVAGELPQLGMSFPAVIVVAAHPPPSGFDLTTAGGG
jgi:hypothetical protein